MNGASFLPFVGALVLASCAGGLGYLLSLNETTDITASESPTETTATQEPLQQSQRLNLPTAQPDIYYEAITQRPIFEPTRRPFAAAPAVDLIITEVPSDTAITLPDNLVLSGVLGGGNSRSAFVSWADGAGEWVRIDDKVDGWVVTEIESEWITLTAGEDTFRLELFE